MNYIKLNQVIHVMLSPIPRYDNASMYKFSDGRFHFLLDYPMGYHQISVNKQSRPKLAFAGPTATMYTYRVIPFGSVNGPAIFIAMIFNLCTEWKKLARSCAVIINDKNNTNKIAVDDLFNHSLTEEIAFTYMECIF